MQTQPLQPQPDGVEAVRKRRAGPGTGADNYDRILITALVVFGTLWLTWYLFSKACLDAGFLLDFEPYYLQSKILHDSNVNPYCVQGSKLGWHLPTTLPLTYAVLIQPLNSLSIKTAEGVFLSVSFLLILASVYLVVRLLKLPKQPALVVLGVALCIYPTAHALASGQVGPALFFLTLASIALFVNARPVASAMVLSLAIAIKVTPVFLLPVFLCRRHYRYLLLTAMFFFFWQGITAMAAGLHNTIVYWTHRFPEINRVVVVMWANQSFVGYIQRFLLSRGIHLNCINQIVPLLLIGGSTLYLAAKHLRQCSPGDPSMAAADQELLLTELSAMMILTCLSTPIGWAHHFLVVILPLALIVRNLAEGSAPPRRWVFLTLAVVLLAVPEEAIFQCRQDLPLLNVLKMGPTLFGSLVLLGLLGERMHDLSGRLHGRPCADTAVQRL